MDNNIRVFICFGIIFYIVCFGIWTIFDWKKNFGIFNKSFYQFFFIFICCPIMVFLFVIFLILNNID